MAAVADVEVVAAYAVEASTAARVTLPEGMDLADPDMIALYLAEDVPVSVDLCHECGRHVSNPEVVALSSFTLGGVDYQPDGSGHWVPAGGESRG